MNKAWSIAQNNPQIYTGRQWRALAPQAHDILSTGLPSLDALLHGGLPKGHIIELVGHEGRTSLAMTFLKAATSRAEVVAWVDSGHAFDPHSAQAAGIDAQQLLWVRVNRHLIVPGREPHYSQRVLKAVELVLHAGGFSIVVFDADLSGPISSCWVRLRRQLEKQRGILIVLAPQGNTETLVGSSAAIRLRCALQRTEEGSALEVRLLKHRYRDPTGYILLGQGGEAA